MNQDLLKERLANYQYDDVLHKIYIDAGRIPYQRDRYLCALSQFEVHFGKGACQVLKIRKDGGIKVFG